jgi:Family of unknown function (DUF6665)
MSGVRPPRSIMPRDLGSASFNVFENEIAQEKISTLADAGKKAEKAMEALHAFDAAPTPGLDQLELVRAAARAVWAWFIQRELCGLRNHQPVIQSLNIPAEVLNRLGEMPKR